MPLTTADSQKIADNVNTTDVNGNIEVPSARTQSLSPEAAILFNKSIVARPLMVPEVCSLRVKNSEYRYRWVNKLSNKGQMYMQRKAQGFLNATTDDVDLLGGDAAADKGEITAGDLILMKIRADLYDGAMKYNMEKALTMSRTRGVHLEGASSDVFSDSVAKRVSVSNEPFTRGGKAQPFIPDNPDALIEASISSGRVQSARTAVEEFREAKQPAKK